MSRYYPKARQGDRISTVLVAAGFNFGLLPFDGLSGLVRRVPDPLPQSPSP